MDLKQRFYLLVSKYTENDTLINNFWNVIDLHYSENHRSYHNFNHITELFYYFDTYKSHIQEPDCMAFSIFYHDIIYNIWKKDNENKSALFAIEHLTQINIKAPFVAIIQEQIIATKTHNTIANDTKWMIDFDLAILGQPEEIYNAYSKKIREEYKLIPALLYRKGRKKVLQHFIDKPFIYATQKFRYLFEKQAKLNLSSELKSL